MTATAPSSPAPPRGAGPLRRRDVRLLLAGQATSELGSQVGSIALPLVAVLGLGASPLRVGVLTAAGTISFAVGGLPAGVWVDRLPRRPVLVGVDLVRGLALATVPVAGALGRLTLAHLAVVALAVGMGRVLFDVAYPSYLPALVGRDELVGANAYLETSRSASQLTGPGLGGWLVQTADGATAVLADAVSFLASAGCLLAIRVARGADTARLIWLPVTVTAPFALCTPLTAPGWRVALFPLGVAVTSFGQALYNIAQVSYRQARCPPELLGRMNASIRFLVFGALPLGGLLASPPAPAGERS